MTAFSKKYYRSVDPLINLTSGPRPLPWADLFGRSAPLELEIGFGNGEYLNRLSLEQPSHDYVGVEVAWASMKRALRRLAKTPRPNVKVMKARAEVALAYGFSPESLSLIRALFPVPWPDERQVKKRLFSTEFLNLAANRLKKDGHFIIVTDSPELAEWTLSEAASSAISFEAVELPAVMDTKYERKWQVGGRDIFYHLTGRKNTHPTAPVIEEIPMQAYYMDKFDPATYRPKDEAGEQVVRFGEMIFDAAKDEALLRTLTVEGPLTQEFFIRISAQGGRWKISPAIPSQLMPTQGVARALQLVAASGPS